MSTTMASFSPPTHFPSSSLHSKSHHLFIHKTFISLRPDNNNNNILSPLKASSSSGNGVGTSSGSAATAVESPLTELAAAEVPPPPPPAAVEGSTGANGSVGGAVAVSGFVDPRWVGGNWDLKQFQKNDNTTDWDAVIDAEARRRKWLEDYPESSSNENPVVFDTSIIPWWAWIKRFHLPEAELLNGRAAMIGFFMAYLVDSLTGVGLVDQTSNFFCKTLLFIAVAGVLLIRKNEDVDRLKKLWDETTFYDKQWQATWQDEENSSTSKKE